MLLRTEPERPGLHPDAESSPPRRRRPDFGKHPLRRAVFAVTLLACWYLAAGPAAASTHRAWSGRSDSGRDIFYESSAAPGQIVSVTASPADDITPALSRDGAGRLHLFWVRRDGDGQSLYHSTLQDPGWDTPRRLPTGRLPVSHPAALLDDRGVLWLAWTAFDGEDDEIYAMSLTAGVWSPPVLISRDDAVPDIHPVLGLDDEGVPWIYWRGYDGQAYSGYVSRLRDGAWTPERNLGERDSYRQLIFDELKTIDTATLPDGSESVTTYREEGPVPLLPGRLREVLR